MRIEIEGYKNLEKIDFEITDNKINMIFGMSGSGKSSITGALLGDNLEDNATIGKDIDQVIRVNESGELPKIACFNNQSLEKYVINKRNDDVINIVIDNKKSIIGAEKALKERFYDLNIALQTSQSTYDELFSLKKELGSDLTNKGELKASAKINKLEKSLTKISNKKVVMQIQSMPPKQFKWIKEGMKFKKDDKCPFCERNILKKKQKNLEELDQFEEKTIESVIKIQENRNELIDSIDMSLKGLKKLKTEMIGIAKALADYEKVKIFSDEIQNYEYTNWNTNLSFSDEFKKYFPYVFRSVNKLLKNVHRLKLLMEKSQENTKNVLSRRLSVINKYLVQMSVPYEIIAEYANGRIKSYKITHIDDLLQKDRPSAPSEGEKAIIALIMFVFECKKSDNSLIIIDDPASAYDDFRRSQILKLIEKELDHKTILLLSHDDKFAKYAVADKYKKTDKLYYFENFGEKVSFVEITKEDFGDFDDFVLDRIKSTDDYIQKIINLRLLFEGHHSKIAYQYLSAILHRVSNKELEILLQQRNTTEDRVIELIKRDYTKLDKIEIPKYSDDVKVETKKYSILEKAIWARENVKNALDGQNLIDEMNEFAHINGKLKVCLNPYKYNFCTKRLYNFLQSLNIDI